MMSLEALREEPRETPKACHHMGNESEECSFLMCPLCVAFIGWWNKAKSCEYQQLPEDPQEQAPEPPQVDGWLFEPVNQVLAKRREFKARWPRLGSGYVQVDLTMAWAPRRAWIRPVVQLPPGHSVCPHVSNQGKPCLKPVGHGRHIFTENTSEALGVPFRFLTMRYICECGAHYSRRDELEKHLKPLARRWARAQRQLIPPTVQEYRLTRLQEYAATGVDPWLNQPQAFIQVYP